LETSAGNSTTNKQNVDRKQNTRDGGASSRLLQNELIIQKGPMRSFLPQELT